MTKIPTKILKCLLILLIVLLTQTQGNCAKTINENTNDSSGNRSSRTSSSGNKTNFNGTTNTKQAIEKSFRKAYTSCEPKTSTALTTKCGDRLKQDTVGNCKYWKEAPFTIMGREKRSVFHVRWNPNEKFIVESYENPAINSSKLAPHPRLKVSKTTKLTLNPKLYMCHDKYSQMCENKTTIFKERILQAFDKSMTESLNESNFYNVNFKPLFGDSFEEQYYPSTCLVMEAGVRALKRKDPPFNKLQFGKLFPKQKLFRQSRNIKSCAIVSSAGSMGGSKLGRFIDTHDIVMRFNHAPTRGYEVDVGSKTTIRVVNSQVSSSGIALYSFTSGIPASEYGSRKVVTKPEFDFTRAPIFQNITIAAWDPGKYNGTLEDWLTTSDYDLFTNYEMYRRRYPKSRAFLIDPHSIWRLWQSLQMFAGHRPILKNPPSSGFIGLALLLPYCPIVDFLEYIPSTRLNGRCHYYSKEVRTKNRAKILVHPPNCLLSSSKMNSACTFGAWHPLAAEKLMALDMNVADDTSVFQFGILRIRRPDTLLCGFNFLGY